MNHRNLIDFQQDFLWDSDNQIAARLKFLLQSDNIIVSNDRKVMNFLNNFRLKDTLFAFDFDGTMISPWWVNSWSPILTSSCGEAVWEMHKYFAPIEMAHNYEHMRTLCNDEHRRIIDGLDFFQAKKIFMSFRREFIFEMAIKHKVNAQSWRLTDCDFRAHWKTFLQRLINNSLDTIVVSAGMWDFIQNFFIEQGIDSSKFHIISNFFILDENGIIVGFDREKIITSFNKKHLDYSEYGIHHKDFAIQFGDWIWDAHMVVEHFSSENTLNIWFLNSDYKRLDLFKEHFDVIFVDKNSWFEQVSMLLGV